MMMPAMPSSSRIPTERVQRIGGHGPVFYEMWNTRETPARIDRRSGEPAEQQLTLPPPPNGTRIRILDIPPEIEAMKAMDAESARAHFAGNRRGGGVDASGRGRAHPSCTARRPSITDRHRRRDHSDRGRGESIVRAGDVVVQARNQPCLGQPLGRNCRIAFVLIDGSSSRVFRPHQPHDHRMAKIVVTGETLFGVLEQRVFPPGLTSMARSAQNAAFRYTTLWYSRFV